jgi:hypothetical protein
LLHQAAIPLLAEGIPTVVAKLATAAARRFQTLILDSLERKMPMDWLQGISIRNLGFTI